MLSGTVILKVSNYFPRVIVLVEMAQYSRLRIGFDLADRRGDRQKKRVFFNVCIMWLFSHLHGGK